MKTKTPLFEARKDPIVGSFDDGPVRYERRLTNCGKTNCSTCHVGGVKLVAHGPYWYLCTRTRAGWTRIYIGRELDTTKYRTKDKRVDWQALMQKRVFSPMARDIDPDLPGMPSTSAQFRRNALKQAQSDDFRSFSDIAPSIDMGTPSLLPLGPPIDYDDPSELCPGLAADGPEIIPAPLFSVPFYASTDIPLDPSSPDGVLSKAEADSLKDCSSPHPTLSLSPRLRPGYMPLMPNLIGPSSPPPVLVVFSSFPGGQRVTIYDAKASYGQVRSIMRILDEVPDSTNYAWIYIGRSAQQHYIYRSVFRSIYKAFY